MGVKRVYNAFKNKSKEKNTNKTRRDNQQAKDIASKAQKERREQNSSLKF